MDAVRQIDDIPLTGFENMSRDEAMLDLACDVPIPATFRFFQWDRKTLSIGRLQRVYSIDFRYLEERQIPLVRRPTGGRAILHDREITFSLFLPLLFFGTALNPALQYDQLKRVLHRLMESLGITVDDSPMNEPYLLSPYCFSLNVAHEITIGGQKILGVAQTRGKCGVLFQGSFLIDADRQEVADCFLEREKVLHEVTQNLVTLKELLHKVPPRETLIGLFIQSMEEVWECASYQGSWSVEEIDRSLELVSEKYYPGSPFVLGNGQSKDLA